MKQRHVFLRLTSCLLVAACVVLSPLSSFAAQAATLSPVLIGEVAWAGSSLSTADEWLELWNTSASPVSVAGWSLRGAGDSGKNIPLPSGATIAAYGTFLISNYDSSDSRSVLAVTPQVVTTTVSLSNSALKIDLLDASGAVVDTAGTGGAPPAGASLPIKLSMIRNGDTWTSATSAMDLKSGTADLATPGVCDGCAPPVAPTPTPAPDPTTLSPTPDPTPISTSTLDLTLQPTDTSTTSITDTSAIPSPTIMADPMPIPTATSTDPTPTSTVVTDPTTLPIVEDPTTTSTQPTADQTTEQTTTTVSDVTTTTVQTVMLEPSLDASSTPVETTTSIVTSTTDTPPTSDTSSTPTVSLASSDTSTLLDLSAPMDQVPQDTVTVTATPAPQPKPAYQMLRVSEVMSDPASGKEWIELTSLDQQDPIALDGCTLHDSKSRILTITKATLDPTVSRFLVVQLASSHLNNDGDAVSLYDPNGQLLDTMSYGNSNKGMSWIHYPDIIGPWQQTREPTPGTANIFLGEAAASTPAPANTATQITPTLSSVLVTEQSPSIAAQLPTTTQNLITKAPPVPKPKNPTGTPLVKNTPSSAIDPATIYAGIAAPIHPKVQKAASKTLTTTASIIPITFDMLNSGPLFTQRVLLHGTVATPPGFFHNRSFVLQSPDGRGILVTTPANQPQPEFSSSVSVVGTIEFDDYNNPTLRIGAKDRWTTNGTSTEPTRPRLVDLLAPSTEDAWSLVQVTGTIRSISSGTIHLDLDDASLDVLVRPSVGYHIDLLKPNDIVSVTGILDTAGDAPKLMPRHADEITLVSQAPVAAVQSTVTSGGTTIPGWTPAGAAGGAIAVTEGVKQLQRRRKQKQLEKKMRDLIAVT